MWCGAVRRGAGVARTRVSRGAPRATGTVGRGAVQSAGRVGRVGPVGRKVEVRRGAGAGVRVALHTHTPHTHARACAHAHAHAHARCGRSIVTGGWDGAGRSRVRNGLNSGWLGWCGSFTSSKRFEFRPPLPDAHERHTTHSSNTAPHDTTRPATIPIPRRVHRHVVVFFSVPHDWHDHTHTQHPTRQGTRRMFFFSPYHTAGMTTHTHNTRPARAHAAYFFFPVHTTRLA